MKSVFKSLIAFAGFALIAPSAFAVSAGGFFAEPGVTWTFASDTTGEVQALGDTSGEAKGLGLMGRAGLHIEDIILLGLDARYSFPKFKDSTLTSGHDNVKATEFNWGPFVGVQTPVAGLRVWGSYIVDGTLDPDEVNSVNAKFNKGKGYRLGAGMYFTMVSVNLEYQDIKYDNIEKQGGVFAGTYDFAKLHDKAWIASVSFPIAL